MAIPLTLVLAPRDTPVTIHSDSKAAMKIAENLLDDEDAPHEYEKSDVLYLAAKARTLGSRSAQQRLA
ncbi:hypothetical protein GGF44_000309 [Coemansia sp. RSA 1694]|nr:hypothetical protein GGF44_006711 [Coemansia sp. RSA 1694]KAJ2644923.1 hypothetical protein GGF44_000309 [Coemansia sp. RSA 1694]